MSHPPPRCRRNHNPATVWMLAVASLGALALGDGVAVAAEKPPSAPVKQTAKRNTMKLRVKIGTESFTASLEDNATATAFKALLPATVRMTELNGNEKYFRFSGNVPTNASNPG